MRPFLVLVLALLCSGSFARSQDWGKPVWQEEFNQPVGSPLDPQKWSFDIGNLRVNHELQIYCPGVPSQRAQSTPRSEAGWREISVCDPRDGNVSFDGEHLVLRAVRRNEVWTSGRIKTQGHQAFQYGRIEARMKLPFGAGIWPAFWALGESIAKVGWPASGEIDFMESVPEHGGLGPSRIRSTVHGPGYSGDFGVRNDVEFPRGQRVDDGFHTYGAIWSPYMIQFFLDNPNNIFFVLTPHELSAGKAWVYNQPFFLILNLAVGGEGSWPGPAEATTPTPAEALVDYVRVYKSASIAGPRIEAPGLRMRAGESAGVHVKMTAPAGSGRMYVDCLSVDPGVNCGVSPYVVDFGTEGEAEVTLSITAQKTPIKQANVKITAYTLSGDESSANVRVEMAE